MISLHPHNILEQQPPFLFVDKICKKETNRIHCIKYLAYNEPYFSGHFPTNPIFPGVLMIEAAAQASMIMVTNINNQEEKKRGYLVKVNNVKYINPAFPGDRLDVLVELKEKMGNYYTVKFNIYKDENEHEVKIAKGEMVFYVEGHSIG